MAKQKTEKSEQKPVKVAFPTKFTANSIVDYVATRNDMSKKDVRQVLEDFYAVIEQGLMKGARVPVGSFGKMFVKIRPAAPARKGRNPLTGEEIMLKPRPKMKVPKFSFAKSFKEKVKNS
jgi:nucleoid DNA-binding protein